MKNEIWVCRDNNGKSGMICAIPKTYKLTIVDERWQMKRGADANIDYIEIIGEVGRVLLSLTKPGTKCQLVKKP